jgi:hypothetical protein
MPNITQTQAGNADPVSQPPRRRWQELRMEGGGEGGNGDAGAIRGTRPGAHGGDAGKKSFVAFECPGAGFCNGCGGVK